MKTILIIITMLITVSLAGAELYQWVAVDGSVTFKDSAPPASKKRTTVKVYKDSDFKPAPPLLLASAERGNKSTPGPAMAATVKKERFSGTVEIYVTDWCGYCERAISYMSSKGIPFVAYDIEKDSSASQRFKELGGRGVPLIIIGANRMSGFSAERLEHYLNNGK
jgi:glutaredoxin